MVSMRTYGYLYYIDEIECSLNIIGDNVYRDEVYRKRARL